MKYPSTQILRNVDGRGIHGNPALHPAGTLDPVDMLMGALAKENAYRITQFTKASITFNQLGGGFLVFSQLYQFTHRFTRVLQWQGDIVLHKISVPNAQLAPVALVAGRLFMQRITGRLHRAKELVRLLERLGNMLYHPALSQH